MEKTKSSVNNSSYPDSKMLDLSESFYLHMKNRRSARAFIDKKISFRIIENCLKTANSAPSGANMQPWHFVVIQDPKIKKSIRNEAEKIEKEFYQNKATQEWVKAVKPLGTTYHKPFLEVAPYLIVVFVEKYELQPDGDRVEHYYASESVGIATGMLITAIHHCGLVCLPYTPMKMRFLNEILERPDSERPFLILAVGLPDKNVKVPDIQKKSIEDVITII
jgi:iodotyrosine deiodinase